VALGQVFSQYFGFPCQPSFHQLLHNHPHLSSGAGTIGQKWPQYMGLSPASIAIKNGPGVDSASNRNEYQEYSWNALGGERRLPRRADNLAAIYEPIF
jgi:hypothetical protein